MHAQATRSRRYGFNWMVMTALLIGALAIATATLVLSDTLTLPFTSENQAVTARPLDRMAEYNRIGFLEQNVQLPDGILPVPAQGLEYMRFLERETWAYDGDDSAASPEFDEYLYLEEYVAGQEMDDASSTAPGIHPDEEFTYAPDE